VPRERARRRKNLPSRPLRRAKKKEAARVFYASRPGGLFRIDQEVVTLRGLPGNSGLPAQPEHRTESNPNSPVVCGL